MTGTLSDAPIRVRRKTTRPVIWRWTDDTGAPLPLAERYRLTIDLPGTPAAIVVEHGDPRLARDETAYTLTWHPTVEQSTRLPRGPGAVYELLAFTGVEVDIAAGGRVIAEGWTA